METLFTMICTALICVGCFFIAQKYPKKKEPKEEVPEQEQRKIERFNKHFDALMNYDVDTAYRRNK